MPRLYLLLPTRSIDIQKATGLAFSASRSVRDVGCDRQPRPLAICRWVFENTVALFLPFSNLGDTMSTIDILIKSFEFTCGERWECWTTWKSCPTHGGRWPFGSVPAGRIPPGN